MTPSRIEPANFQLLAPPLTPSHIILPHGTHPNSQSPIPKYVKPHTSLETSLRIHVQSTMKYLLLHTVCVHKFTHTHTHTQSSRTGPVSQVDIFSDVFKPQFFFFFNFHLSIICSSLGTLPCCSTIFVLFGSCALRNAKQPSWTPTAEILLSDVEYA